MQQDEEAQAVAQVCERLRSRFPDAPADDIDQVVAEVHRGFDGNPIRDFIPVLVEREAANRFRGRRRDQLATSA